MKPTIIITLDESRILTEALKLMLDGPPLTIPLPMAMAEAVQDHHSQSGQDHSWAAYRRLGCQLPALSAEQAQVLYACSRGFNERMLVPTHAKSNHAFAPFVRITRRESLPFNMPLTPA